MTHSEMDELYELYLLGALDSEEAVEISAHLSSDCEYCRNHIHNSSAVISALALLTEPASPPPGLRDRVLSIAQPVPKKSSSWQVAFLLAAAASFAFLIWGVDQRATLRQTTLQLHEVSEQRNQLRAAVEILTESDTRTVKFGETQSATHGRVFLSHNGGVVFLGSHLPQLASGKTFQLWLVPSKGNPKSAGLFTPNTQGISVDVLSQSLNPTEFAAVAVSVEPNGGSPQPTTKPILIVPLG